MSTVSGGRRGRGTIRRRRAALLGLGLLAAIVPAWRLGVRSAIGDEVYYRGAALDMLDGQWLTNTQHPPLVKELMALSHALLGDTVVADRLPGAVAAWATGLVVAALVWRAGTPGRATTLAGLLAAAVWWVLPYGPSRTALLEGPMTFFVLAAQLAFVLAAARRAPRWLVVGGLLVGLATACKLTGALALAGALPAVWQLRREGALRPRSWQPGLPVPRTQAVGCLLGGVLLGGLAYLLTYAPFGGVAVGALADPITFQLGHAATGHPVVVAGLVREDPPWWTPFAFQADRLGVWASVGLWAAALVGVVRHRRVLAPVWVTLAVLVVVLTTSPLALTHYHYVWWPCLMTLAGAALVPSRPLPAPAARGRVPRAVRIAAATTVAAVLALLPVGWAGARHVAAVAQTGPSGYDRAAALLAAEIPAGEPAVVWADVPSVRSAMPDQRITTRLPADLNPAALVYVESWAVRKEGTDLATWERCRAATYTRHDLGSVVVLLRDDRADDRAADSDQTGTSAAVTPGPGCDTLRRRR